jgi:hypothetical protein
LYGEDAGEEKNDAKAGRAAGAVCYTLDERRYFALGGIEGGQALVIPNAGPW